jgi:hypothetical protein
VVRQDLADRENIVAPACDCLADQHFRISVRIGNLMVGTRDSA